ncbi:MAG: hypothetical protein C5B50_21935 [Verrucomicrobia bacterium]|nr:MAG: hypothetical protein C5B50_21935 [Verrucomicrobiota bacterium]
MKFSWIHPLCIVSLVSWLLCGCASHSPDPATKKKGHWVTLPPETGSYLPRHIWVPDNGEADASASVNNVQTGSAADVQRMQDRARTFKPAGGP